MTSTNSAQFTSTAAVTSKNTTTGDEDNSPYATALYKIQTMTGKEIASIGQSLFPTNMYQRTLFHCWVNTVKNCENPVINPRYYTPNLIGAPGFGKSGLTYEFAQVVKPWIDSIAGGPVTFKIVVRTFAGINDFADIMGIVHVDTIEWATRLAPPVAFPKQGDKTLGILFIDDFNRGHAHVIAAGMEFVNTGAYNDYRLPLGWSMCAAMNPQGGKHKVTSIDEAQSTRFVNLPYSPPRKTFIEQLVKQEVDDRILAYFMKFKEQGECPTATNVLPEPRIVNWRTCTMFAHLYSSLQYDDHVLNETAFSFFGPNAIRDLQSILQGEMPLSPEEVLGGTEKQRRDDPEIDTPKKAWETAKTKMEEFASKKRTDIITVTGHRLIMHVNKKDVELSQEQIDNLANFLLMIPKEVALDCMRQLVHPSAPKNDQFRAVLTTWGSSDGKSAGILAKRFFEVNQEIQAKLKDITAKINERTKANAVKK